LGVETELLRVGAEPGVEIVMGFYPLLDQLDSNRMFDYNGDGAAVTPGAIPGWPTTAGWDMTTGFGTPRAAGFVAALRAAKNGP